MDDIKLCHTKLVDRLDRYEKLKHSPEDNDIPLAKPKPVKIQHVPAPSHVLYFDDEPDLNYDEEPPEFEDSPHFEVEDSPPFEDEAPSSPVLSKRSSGRSK